MPTRRDMMFDATKGSMERTSIPSTVQFRLDRKAGRLKELAPEEKMLCALRKVLTRMSNRDEDGRRYYIDGDRVQLTRTPTATAARAGERKSYRAAGRCKIGVCHPGGSKTSKVIEFAISYRDTRDDRGLADVEYFEPTTIKELPRSTPINTSSLE